MVQRAHLQRPEAQPSDEKPYEDLTAQVSKLVEQNQQLALQLSELETKTSRIAEQNQQLSAQLSDIKRRFRRQRRVLKPLSILKYDDDDHEEDRMQDGENWKLMLQLSLTRHGLYRHSEEDVPQPESEAAREKWMGDRQDIVELMMASIRDTSMMDRVRCLGWSRSQDSPKSTYEKILDALGDRYDEEIQLVWKSQHLHLKSNEDLSYAEHYFEELDNLYKRVTRENHSEYFGAVSPLHVLQGIRPYCPELYERHSPKTEYRTFTWDAFFCDIAYNAMLGRFRDYPAELRQGEDDDMHDASDGEPNSLAPKAPLCASWLSPQVGKDFLGGKGILEIWESVIEDAVKEGK